MPHLLVDRIRCDFFTGLLPKRKDSSIGAVAIEVLDTVAALCCLAGSICFIPQYSANVTVFLRGCALFMCGAALYVLACFLAFVNSWMEQGLGSRETHQSIFYLAAASVYLLGTILYWPSSWQTGSISPGQWLEMEYDKSAASQGCASWPQRANLRHQAFEGSILCVVGGLMLCAAAFANMMCQQTNNDHVSKLLIAIASFYMLGSLLFAVCAFVFLPSASCGAGMASIGAGLAVTGSSFYLISGVLSVVRTATILNAPGDSFYHKAFLERDPLAAYRERAPLLSYPSDPAAVAGRGTRSLPASVSSLSSGPNDLTGAYRSTVPASVGVPPTSAAAFGP